MAKVKLSLTCPCGKPISKTSADFGMDCEDDCGRKAFEAGDVFEQNRKRSDALVETMPEPIRAVFDKFYKRKP